MKTINPSTGEIIKKYEAMSFEEVDGIIKKAQEAQEEWRPKSFEERADYLRKIDDGLRSKKEEISRIM
ncbi:MAG: aldehyde dehydrogenase family protein [Balneolaceae bacterium]